MIMTNELGNMYKEAIIAYCKVLYYHLPGQTEKKHIILPE
jgi:hypothetical protein